MVKSVTNEYGRTIRAGSSVLEVGREVPAKLSSEARPVFVKAMVLALVRLTGIEPVLVLADQSDHSLGVRKGEVRRGKVLLSGTHAGCFLERRPPLSAREGNSSLATEWPDLEDFYEVFGDVGVISCRWVNK